MNPAVRAFLVLMLYAGCTCLVYRLLPLAVVQLNPRLRPILPARQPASGAARPPGIPGRLGQSARRLVNRLKGSRTLGRLLEIQRRRLLKSGAEHPQALNRYLRGQLLGIAGTLAAALLLRRPPLQGLLAAGMAAVLLDSRVGSRIRLREKAVEQSFYRVYRFIDSQISAGIKPTDVIKGLHESTDDPLVKPLLVRFVARYSLTLDLGQAVAELRRLHAGPDVDTLGTQLRQLLTTGIAGRSFQRTEELLFTRYFSLLQKRSEAIRSRLLLSAISSMLPILLLFLMPMFYQAISSLNEVFG